MDYSISCRAPSFSSLSSFSPKKALVQPFLSSRVSLPFRFRHRRTAWRNLRVVAAAAAGGSQCGGYYSCLNTPLEPSSPAGRLLAGVLLDNRDCFPVLVNEQLEQLAADRSQAVARMSLSVDSDEAFLHRRIAELKEQECQTVVQDLMYLLICYKFYGISAHLVPRLSKCVYNGRLELCCPSLDSELESIHKVEVLEIVKDHLTSCVGWKAYSNVTCKWSRIQVTRLQLCRVYTASILFGYFLKSASLRQSLEQSLSPSNFDLGLPRNTHLPVSDLLSSGSKNALFNQAPSTKSVQREEASGNPKEQDQLKSYLMGFDSQTVEMCAKPKSKEAMTLIESHSSALFGDDTTGFIDTSFATLKRLALEAIAFGSFLWEAEDCIGNVYGLPQN